MAAILIGLAVFGLVFSTGASADFGFSAYQGYEVLGGLKVSFSSLVDYGEPVMLNFWTGYGPLL